MKNIFVFLSIISICFLSGCSNLQKKYSTVDEYENAMRDVQKKYENLHIRGIGHSNVKKDFNFTAYIKNDMWKEITNYNGINVTVVSNSNGTFLKLPQGYERINKPAMIYPLLHWNRSAKNSQISKKFIGNKKINGMDCRMIKYEIKNADINACVSDKYGIAIYYDNIIVNNNGVEYKNSLELVEINTIDIPDSTFTLN